MSSSTSSTVIKNPLQIHRNHLFYEDRTFLKRHPGRFEKVIPRGASHHAEGAIPGDITFINFGNGQDGIVSFRPVLRTDTFFSGLSGSKSHDEPLLADRSARFMVDEATLTFHLDDQDTKGMAYVCDWSADVETDMGQPYPSDQVKDLGEHSFGIVLVGHESNSNGRPMERMSLYTISKASKDAINAMSIEEIDSAFAHTRG